MESIIFSPGGARRKGKQPQPTGIYRIRKNTDFFFLCVFVYVWGEEEGRKIKITSLIGSSTDASRVYIRSWNALVMAFPTALYCLRLLLQRDLGSGEPTPHLSFTSVPSLSSHSHLSSSSQSFSPSPPHSPPCSLLPSIPSCLHFAECLLTFAFPESVVWNKIMV